ncbi:MAG: hypothetical protein HC815_22090 [Richelia sp. RM1_1_1]|nr:hypothetical protein [Richelia sp. SM2_1_7]NJM21852.1 hypothetical protein [Richelia sp. SM1_7_0]NJN10528.1 hypothetical protein [Richelia sp. RM1_1_1]
MVTESGNIWLLLISRHSQRGTEFSGGQGGDSVNAEARKGKRKETRSFGELFVE